jgi:glycosyltransferase involved in cell wall biosynthesis
MRVLHVITGIDRGGAEGHLFELVRHQRASGMTVAVAYLRGQGYFSGALRGLGAEVHPMGLRFYGDPRPWLRLRQLTSGGDFDLLHAHLPPAELYARLALLGLDALPVIITKHNDERFSPGPFQRPLGRWVGKRAGHVIAISGAVNRYMAGPALGLDAGRLSTIHYGIDAAPFAAVADAEVAALRGAWGLARDALAIGFVGRLVEQKDLDTLLGAFALFAPRCPQARLVIVGRGPLDSRLRRRALELAIDDRVVWAGFRDDIAAVMAAFDIFALSSKYEGLGLVLLEAMAARRPVVATRVSAIPEVVADGETGILVGPGDPEALAAAFERLQDHALRARLGEAGRLRVLGRFTLEQMCRATDELYAACVRARSSRHAVQDSGVAPARASARGSISK